MCGAPGCWAKAVAAAIECCPQGQSCPAAALTQLLVCRCYPRSPLEPLVACSCPWDVGPAWFPTLPSPSPSGCSHGNSPDQSPLLSQSHTNPCELQHCSLPALKGLGHQDHAGKGGRQARAESLLQGEVSGCRKREWPCSCPQQLPATAVPAFSARPARAPGPLQEAITLGRETLLPGSCPAAMPTASTK